jgi:hypothetical protein
MSRKIFYKKNSQYLEVGGLHDQSAATLTYVNTATLTGTMYDASGATVAGCVNVSGQYQASSNGVYRFPVDPSLFDPPAGSNYTLIIDGTSGSKRYHAEIPVQVTVRTLGTET